MKKLYSTRRTTVIGSLVIAATIALAGCGSGSGEAPVSQGQTGDGGSHLTRAHLYSSIDELAADSAAIAVGTVTDQRVAMDIDDATKFTISSFQVSESVKSDALTQRGMTVDIRQIGSGDDDAPTPLLMPGSTYLVYLTPSGLDGDLASHYYVTGANAGLYEEAPTSAARDGSDGGRFVQVDSSEGEPLPPALDLDEAK